MQNRLVADPLSSGVTMASSLVNLLIGIQDHTSSPMCCSKSIGKVSHGDVLSPLAGRNFPPARKFIPSKIEQENKISRETLRL